MGGPVEFQALVRRYQLALERFNHADRAYFDDVNRELSESLYELNQYIVEKKRQLGFPVHQESFSQVMRVS